MDKKFIALLVVLLGAVDANTLQGKSVPNSLLSDLHNWGDIGLTATVNDYVDNTIHMIVPFIQAHGLDPMPLPDIEEGFQVRPVLVTYSAWLRLTNGRMNGLVNVARSGDQNVHYFAKMLRVRVELQFTNLEFFYNYAVKVMNLGPTGNVNGSLNRFVIIVDVLIDFNNDEVHLQEFSMTDIGRLRLRLSGNILYDWLVNPLIAVIVTIFDNIIFRVVEANIVNVVQLAISLINSNLQDVIRAIESFN